jgi:divalent metal cation (Fe/Co/Zn/Cd) transporter
MRGILRSMFVAAHPGRALAIRGRAMRTFGSLVLFAALILLCVGAYILRQEFADPITAQAFGLVAAAFVMAVAATLLYYRVKMKVRRWTDSPIRMLSRR